MKKEATNTFTGGMVKDLHPLTTPNNVLTDALNATLLTYNGNELILQNDMGNVPVGTAKLPAGYVPVGMKEHGGIIYVAAWNPETKKGLVGSFPSPQLLWEGEDWTVNSDGTPIAEVSFNTGEFYVGNFIVTENVKKGLFNFSDGTSREFHPGDRFAIALDSNTNSRLKSYVDAGKIDIYVGVVKKDGSIEIMTKASDNWFFLVGNSNEYVNTKQSKVFTASSSGRLLLIINIITLDSFDLIREYSLIDNNTVNVRFTGKGTLDGETFTSLSSKFDLFNNVTNQSGSVINLVGSSGKQTFEIYPELDYGRVYRMCKKGTIDFTKIKKYQENFHEFRYFVTDKYIKLGWAYEFYNLDNSKSIDYILLDFYEYLQPSSYPNNPTLTLELTKEYYSGNFEDIIRFDEHKELRWKHIYILRLSRKMKDGTFHVITHKMLYLTKLYNESYNNLYKDNDEDADILELHNIGPKEIQLSYSPELDYSESEEVDVEISDPYGNVSTPELYEIDKNSFIVKDPLGDFIDEYKQFTTVLKKDLSGKVKFNTNVNYDKELIIGVPDENKIQQSFANNITINSIDVVRDQVDWQGPSSNLLFKYEEPNNATGTANISKNNLTGEITITGLKDYRVIQGKAAALRDKSYTEDGYVPFFLNYTGSIEDKMKICTFYDYDVRCVAMSGEDSGQSTSINVTLSGKTEVKGPDSHLSGVGGDQNGLTTAMIKMGRPTVSIMCGTDGKWASLRFKNNGGTPFERLYSFYGWKSYDDPYYEVDQDKNFLIAVWKFDDLLHRLVNLMTLKDFLADTNTSACPRLDVMLRCFLSLIFLPGKVNKSCKYTYPINSLYRYESGDSQIAFDMDLSAINISDAMLPDYTSDSDSDYNVRNSGDTLYEIFEDFWENRLPEEHGVVNLIPKVELYTIEDSETKYFTISDDYGLQDILQYYLQDTYDFDVKALNPSINVVQGFKIVDVTKNAENMEASIYKDSNHPLPGMDGTFEWSGTPALKDPMELKSTNTSELGDTLYDWKGNIWRFYYPLNAMFRTRANYEGWTLIGGPNGDAFNELLGRTTALTYKGAPMPMLLARTLGQWTEPDARHGGDIDAPHPYLFTMYSNWSLFRLGNSSY